MSYQMTVTLTDAEYRALSSESRRSGKSLEILLHEVLHQHIQPPETREISTLNRQTIQSYLYEEGVTEYIPTDDVNTENDDAERQYLAHLFGQGQPVSEMVIEDRGPR